MNKTAYIICNQSKAPDFSALGFCSLQLLTPWAFFRRIGNQYDLDHVDMDIARASADAIAKNGLASPLCFNIETLPIDTPDIPLRDHAHDQLIEVCKLYRQHPAHHGRALGFYGVLPVRNFWDARTCVESPEGEPCKKWRAINQAMCRNLHDGDLSFQRGLASYVDRLYPSLYWWYPDMAIQEFIKYVDTNLAAAAEYMKPCFPFVSPFVAGISTRGVFDNWRQQLAHVWEHPTTDGIVLWAVVDKGDWNENAAWWVATKEVLKVVS